jgi:hypothetical protein
VLDFYYLGPKRNPSHGAFFIANSPYLSGRSPALAQDEESLTL